MKGGRRFDRSIPISFVEDEHFDVVEVEVGRIVQMVDKSSGSSDDNVGSEAESGFLRFQVQATCNQFIYLIRYHYLGEKN